MITAAGPVTFEAAEHYDLALTTAGFERRSSFLVRSGLSSARLCAIAFDDNQSGSFQDNLANFRQNGAEIFQPTELGFMELLSRLLADFRHAGGSTLCVDISSMTRQRLAGVQTAIAGLRMEVKVDYFYSVASYADIAPTGPRQLELGPVLPEYAGSLRPSSLPVELAIGLGIEPDRALAAVEYLEPSRTWLFLPKSINPRFDEKIAAANRQVLRMVPESQVLRYPVANAAETYYSLESFSYSANQDSRLVLLPIGPKIFALAALLVGSTGNDHGPSPAVWRIGEASYDKVVDVHEDGNIVGLRVRYS